MIVLSIDVTKLDRARFKEVTLRNGDIAKFCELVLIETPNSEYGDYIAKQGVTKEEREQRLEMPILGNGKNVGKKPSQPQQQSTQRRERPSQAPAKRQRQPDPELDAPEDDIPF